MWISWNELHNNLRDVKVVGKPSGVSMSEGTTKRYWTNWKHREISITRKDNSSIWLK